MLNKLATLIVAAAFGLAVYSPSAAACPGMDKNKDETSIAQKDKTKDKKKAKKKVADKKKSKAKDKAKSKKTDKDGKKVSRK